MPIKSNLLESALLEKGFQKDNGDHRFFYFYYGGKRTTIRTMISHGAAHDISDNLVSKIYKQLKFRKKEKLVKFVECTFTQKDYEKELLEDKHI